MNRFPISDHTSTKDILKYQIIMKGMVSLKKNHLIIISTAFVLLIGIITLILLITIPRNTPENVTGEQSYFNSNPYSSQENNQSAYNSNDVTTMTSQIDIYTIKAYQGHIGVFINNEKEPFKEFNVSLNSLPKEDQELLKEGIKATSQGEVRIILEDYIS